MCKISNLLFASSLLFLSSCGQDSLPEELMYDGQPINPACMPSAVGAGPLNEPETLPVDCDVDHNIATMGTILDSKLEFDRKLKRVKYSQTWRLSGADDEISSNYEYTYVGRVGENLVILSNESSSDGTGRFSALYVIKREGKVIRLIGHIAAGDRWYGGFIGDTELKDGILSYSVAADLKAILDLLKKHGIDKKAVDGWESMQAYPRVRYTADLNQAPANYEYKTKPVEIIEQVVDKNDDIINGRVIKLEK